jgi:Ca-activated chloride channel family protein
MRRVVAAVIVWTLTGAATISLRPLSAREQRPTFRGGVELIVVRVTVTDGEQRPVTGLQMQDFVVLDHGVPQAVSHFLSSDVPLDVALLLDTSSSMRSLLSKLGASAISFLKRLRPGDRGMLASFNDRTEVLANLTGDGDLLRGAVARLRARGDTRLYDGVYVTLGSLSSASREATRRRALVVLSDGQDTSSHLGIDDVRKQAIKSGVPIYPILLLDNHPVAVRMRALTFDRFEIADLARETGGQVIRIDEQTDLTEAYAQIAQELSTQYVLAYPVPATDGSAARASIEVRVPSHPDAVVRAHAGYARGGDAPDGPRRTN